MSKFSKIRSKLAIAFAGAAKNMINRKNLIVNGVTAGVATGLIYAFGLAAGTALLPWAGFAMGSYVAIDGIVGASRALKQDALVSAVLAGKTPRGYTEVEGSTDGLKVFKKKGLFRTKTLTVTPAAA